MLHKERLNPQSLLRLVQQEEKRASRGVLKVFLGYAANVGKTYRLVEELSRRKQRGEDVVVGWAGRCLSPHVQQLVAHLEIVPPLLVDGVPELDVEAILARRPQVCSIDELAHNNAPGSRHATRWEDVLELLEAGISVVTAINVQFLQGLQDRVLALTGKAPREVVPDMLVTDADEVALIDVSPEEVGRRSCSVILPEGGDTRGTLTRQQLRELRGLALLYTADTVEEQLQDYRECHGGAGAIWATQERILVCVTAHERGPSLVERGASAAQRLHAELRAIFVSPGPQANPEQKARVEATLALARNRLAKTEVLTDADPAHCILRYARDHGITQIFIGHSQPNRFFNFLHNSVVGVLIREASGSDVHVIPDSPSAPASPTPQPSSAVQVPSPAIARGKLKVYLGYAAGVGKTYEMLRQGQASLAAGRDVVVGYYQDLGRAATNAQLEALPVIPRRCLRYRDHDFEEMDLPAILERKPEICLVDELPHTNAAGIEHEKRWQDVEALLEAGIDVETTLNIQHLESYNDQLFAITQVRIRETVPDWVVTGADEVVMMDLPPRALLNRLRRGVIYRPEQASAALTNFFRPENLAALRELALRHTAEASEPKAGESSEPQTRETILVCLTDRPSGSVLVRRGKQLADRLRADCFAVYVAPKADWASLPENVREAVDSHFRLARNLHVRTEVLVDREPGRALLDFAHTHAVTQMYLGRSLGGGVRPYLGLGLIERLIKSAPHMQFHIVADR